MLPQLFIQEIVHRSNRYKWHIQQPPMILDKKTGKMKRNNNHMRGKDINNLQPLDLLSESDKLNGVSFSVDSLLFVFLTFRFCFLQISCTSLRFIII